MRNKLFPVLGGFAVTLATLAAPANCHAQSIRESVLKLSTADVEIILNNSQRPFQAPISYQTSLYFGALGAGIGAAIGATR